MKEEIMLESLLKSATDHKVIGDGSIMQTLQEINKVTAEIDKLFAVMDRYKLIEPLRLYFIKKQDLSNVRDVGQSKGIEPPSETHRIAYLELNKYSEEDLKKHAQTKATK
jgi:excinuclease UvrABC helicase subunit UvrB